MNIPNGITSTQPSVTETAQSDALANKALSRNPLDVTKLGQPMPEGSTTRTMSNYLKTIQSAVAVDPPFDADKVASLQNDLASGNYKVDSEKLATSLISSMAGMLAPST